MKTVLFFGNCQTGAVKSVLNLNLKKYKIYTVPCYTKILNKTYFTNLIHKSDIIITQHISDNYRGVDYFSLKYILDNSKNKNKIIIIIPSCHFNFYYLSIYDRK